MANAGKQRKTDGDGRINRQRVLLIGVIFPGVSPVVVEEHLDELQQLAESAGMEVVHRVVQKRAKVDPAFYIGKGKVEELLRLSEMLNLDTMIFDTDLSPAQVKNIQKRAEIRILDRSMLILDIFARNASTREARLQVELARLQYMLPRLTRYWTHLERQLGGIGARGGMGEKQIEVDRRLMRDRITRLKRELQEVEAQRETRTRSRAGAFRVALVGYTNAGKSTLMNVLSGANVLVEDRLFATLDTTVRAVSIEKNLKILLSDTVGFLRKLPHHLIASFRSTLQEAREADLILKVLDSSSPALLSHLNTIESTLKTIGVKASREILIFNKIDLLQAEEILKLRQSFPEAILISAYKQLHLDELINAIRNELLSRLQKYSLTLPPFFSKTIDFVHSSCARVNKSTRDKAIFLEFMTDPATYQKVLWYRSEEERFYREQVKSSEYLQ